MSRQLLPVAYTYKNSKQAAEMATRLLQLYKTNLPPSEAWNKNIATKISLRIS